jgi:hypothetical protein
MDNNTLEQVFSKFTGGKKEMANKELAKLTKDCGLLDKVLTNTEVDLIFSKVKVKTSKVLTYDQFVEAVKLMAAKKKTDFDTLSATITSSGGPTFTGTKTDYVKFHDDKSLYTGVYAKGGPTNVDVGSGGAISDISQLCDRTGSDVRGVKK